MCTKFPGRFRASARSTRRQRPTPCRKSAPQRRKNALTGISRTTQLGASTKTILGEAPKLQEEPQMSEDSVKCPECGSSQVHAEKRGWNVWTGMIGSGKIVLTCLKCGHKFKPGEGATD